MAFVVHHRSFPQHAGLADSFCVCVCGMAASGAQQNLAENYFLSCVREWVGWIGISDAFVALHATHM